MPAKLVLPATPLSWHWFPETRQRSVTRMPSPLLPAATHSRRDELVPVSIPLAPLAFSVHARTVRKPADRIPSPVFSTDAQSLTVDELPAAMPSREFWNAVQ